MLEIKLKNTYKKLIHYFSIFTIILGTSFASINSASADAVTIANNATAVLADIDEAVDTITVTGPAGAINTAAAAITADTLTNTNAATTLTLSGTGGLVLTGDVTAAAATTFTIAMGTTNLTLGGAVVATGTPVITMNGATLTLNVDSAEAIAGTINGAGTIAVAANAKTLSGIIGGTTGITNITTAAGSTAIFNAAVTGTGAYTGTTTGAVQFKGATTTMGSYAIGADGTMTANSTAAQTITGTIDGSLAANQGSLVINGHADGVTIASAVGSSKSLALVTVTNTAIFNSDVSTLAMTVADAKVATVKGNLTLGATDAILTTAGTLTLAGTSAQTVAGADAASVIKGNAAGSGIVSVTNTSGVTFDNALGTGAALRQISLGTGAKATIKSNTNLVDRVTLGQNSVLTVNKDAFTAAGTLFTNEADRTETVIADIHTTAKIHMPANFKGGAVMNLLVEAGADVVADAGILQLQTNIQDTPLVNYVASVADVTTVVITANNKSDSTTASELGVNTNNAKALLQAVDSIVAGSDATALTAVSDVFNAQTTTDTQFAKQVAPQDDMISGSTLASKAVTGTVQGIISNRMASLRSGDAYYGMGMSAGNMTAKSGFIQAFGSEVEQKNKTVGSGTQYGYESSSAGFALGFDGTTDTGATVGLSFSMSNTDLDGKGTGKAKNDIDSYTASLYWDKTGQNGYVEGSLTYGLNENKTSRLVNTAGLSRTYTGSYDSNQLSLSLAGGAPNAVGASGYVTPFIGVTGTYIKTDAYTESSTTAGDSLRLRVSQDDVNSLVGKVGVKYHNVTDKGTPMISLSLNNEFGDDTINSTNTYQGGGSSFTTSTDVEPLSATLGLGYSYGSDTASIEFAYEAEANDDKYLGHYGSIKIVGKF